MAIACGYDDDQEEASASAAAAAVAAANNGNTTVCDALKSEAADFEAVWAATYGQLPHQAQPAPASAAYLSTPLPPAYHDNPNLFSFTMAHGPDVAEQRAKYRFAQLSAFISHLSAAVEDAGGGLTASAEQKQELMAEAVQQVQQQAQEDPSASDSGAQPSASAASAVPASLKARLSAKQAERDAVWLGTIHQAKGLQWPVVHVARANEGVLPLCNDNSSVPPPSTGAAAAAAHNGRPPTSSLAAGSRPREAAIASITSSAATASAGSGAAAMPSASAPGATSPNQEEEEESDEMSEERRVMYVACSRPESELHVSYISEHKAEGNRLLPSRFIASIPSRLVKKAYQYSQDGPPTESPSAPAAGGQAGAPAQQQHAPGRFAQTLSNPHHS